MTDTKLNQSYFRKQSQPFQLSEIIRYPTELSNTNHSGNKEIAVKKTSVRDESLLQNRSYVWKTETVSKEEII